MAPGVLRPADGTGVERRILYLEPVRHSHFHDHCAALVRGSARPGTDVHVMSLPPRVGEACLFAEREPGLMEDLAARAEDAAGSYDAIVIGCASDPCVAELRERLPVPVVGPFAASLSLAAVRSRRVGVVTPEPESEVDWLRGRAEAYGLGSVVRRIRAVRVGHPEGEKIEAEMASSPRDLADGVLHSHRASVADGGSARAAAERLVREDGVGAVVFACTLWGGMLGELIHELPVVDPVRAAVHVAEELCASSERRSGQEVG